LRPGSNRTNPRLTVCIARHPLNTSVRRARIGWISGPTLPAEVFRAIGRFRKEAGDEMDRLIRFLDETDYRLEHEPEDKAHDADESQA